MKNAELLIAIVREAERDVKPLIERLVDRSSQIGQESCAVEVQESFVVDAINLKKRMRWLVSQFDAIQFP